MPFGFEPTEKGFKVKEKPYPKGTPQKVKKANRKKAMAKVENLNEDPYQPGNMRPRNPFAKKKAK